MGAKNLKEKHQDKPWAKKITGVFSKVRNTNDRRPSMNEDAAGVSSESSQGIEEEKKEQVQEEKAAEATPEQK